MSESTLFQFPDDLPFAAFVNPKIGDTQRLGLAFQYNQILQSYSGDPNAGMITPGTTLAWNKLTLSQGLEWEWYYVEAAKLNPLNPLGALPKDLEAILTANAGPVDRWNGSYEYWGVVPGVPGSVATMSGVEVGTAKVTTIIPN